MTNRQKSEKSNGFFGDNLDNGVKEKNELLEEVLRYLPWRLNFSP